MRRLRLRNLVLVMVEMRNCKKFKDLEISIDFFVMWGRFEIGNVSRNEEEGRRVVLTRFWVNMDLKLSEWGSLNGLWFVVYSIFIIKLKNREGRN